MLRVRPKELDLGVIRQVPPLLLPRALEGFIMGEGGDDVDPAAEPVLLAGFHEIPGNFCVRVGGEMCYFFTARVGDHLDQVL